MAYLHYFSDLHCLTCGRNANFELLHCTPQREQKKSDLSERISWFDSHGRFRGLFMCSNCRSSIVMDISLRHEHKSKSIHAHSFLNRINRALIDTRNTSSQPNHLSHEIKIDGMGLNIHDLFIIEKMIPDSTNSIPEHLPNEIYSLFVDDLLQALSSPRLTLISCRAILESACKDKLGKEKSKLVKMIDDLVKTGVIPLAMADWAHTIRQLGNDAVHDGPAPTSTEASEVVSFTTVFLELLYSYPKRIAVLRETMNS